MVAPVERREVGITSDHELVAAVRSGHDRAFESLYERYHRRIAAYVYGMVNDYGRAEDITQEVFISALRRMRETERPIAFKPWIYEIAKNACIDQFRRSRRAEEISYDAEDGAGALEYARLTALDGGPDRVMDAKQQLDHLCGAFGGLSETHHQILVMRELEGLSYREIGERMGLSRPSVESTLFRARRRLTEEYDELVSGERCLRIRGVILAAGRGLGSRDERRLARHIAHCQSCRREARLAGVEVGPPRLPLRDAVAAKVAGILPLPWLLRLRRGDASGADGAAPGFVAQFSGSLGTAAEPLAGWGKAAAAAAVVLVAGAGAGAVSQLSHEDRGADPVRTTFAAKPAERPPARRDAARREIRSDERPADRRAAEPRESRARRTAPAAAVPPRDGEPEGSELAGPDGTPVPPAPSLPEQPPAAAVLPTPAGADEASRGTSVPVAASPEAAVSDAAAALDSADSRAGELAGVVAGALGG